MRAIGNSNYAGPVCRVFPPATVANFFPFESGCELPLPPETTTTTSTSTTPASTTATSTTAAPGASSTSGNATNPNVNVNDTSNYTNTSTAPDGAAATTTTTEAPTVVAALPVYQSCTYLCIPGFVNGASLTAEQIITCDERLTDFSVRPCQKNYCDPADVVVSENAHLWGCARYSLNGTRCRQKCTYLAVASIALALEDEEVVAVRFYFFSVVFVL